MDDAFAGGEPLNISAAEARSCAKRVGVIDVSLAHDRHGLESAVRVLRESGDHAAVIHPPAVLTFKIHADVAS